MDESDGLVEYAFSCFRTASEQVNERAKQRESEHVGERASTYRREGSKQISGSSERSSNSVDLYCMRLLQGSCVGLLAGSLNMSRHELEKNLKECIWNVR